MFWVAQPNLWTKCLTLTLDKEHVCLCSKWFLFNRFLPVSLQFGVSQLLKLAKERKPIQTLDPSFRPLVSVSSQVSEFPSSKLLCLSNIAGLGTVCAVSAFFLHKFSLKLNLPCLIIEQQLVKLWVPGKSSPVWLDYEVSLKINYSVLINYLFKVFKEQIVLFLWLAHFFFYQLSLVFHDTLRAWSWLGTFPCYKPTNQPATGYSTSSLRFKTSVASRCRTSAHPHQRRRPHLQVLAKQWLKNCTR